VTARRDAYVAGFALLNAMGQAEAEDLGLDGGTLYNPVAHYNRTRDRASDWNEDSRRAPASTRTAPEGAPSPVAQVVGPVDPRANRPVTQPRQ
jgi:outer membrane protein